MAARGKGNINVPINAHLMPQKPGQAYSRHLKGTIAMTGRENSIPFVHITQCVCQNCTMYLSTLHNAFAKLHNVFFRIVQCICLNCKCICQNCKCICPNCTMYLSKLQHVFLQITKHFSQRLSKVNNIKCCGKSSQESMMPFSSQNHHHNIYIMI